MSQQVCEKSHSFSKVFHLPRIFPPRTILFSLFFFFFEIRKDQQFYLEERVDYTSFIESGVRGSIDAEVPLSETTTCSNVCDEVPAKNGRTRYRLLGFKNC